MSLSVHRLLLTALILAATTCGQAQVSISLSAIIGPAGTNAATVAGAGNVVNATGIGLDGGVTLLTAVGSTGSSSFDFNSGFADHLDRAIGSNPGAGGANIYVDRKYDSSGTGPLVLDTNNDGNFADETAQSGFGMHADGFITFDLAAVRAAQGLSPDAAFTLTGWAGVANYPSGQTSGAIILDSAPLAVFDWTTGAPVHQFDTFSLSVSGSARYLTFIGLSGLDLNNWGDHVGFANVQLQAVPEASTLGLLTVGGVAALLWRPRRRP